MDMAQDLEATGLKKIQKRFFTGHKPNERRIHHKRFEDNDKSKYEEFKPFVIEQIPRDLYT